MFVSFVPVTIVNFHDSIVGNGCFYYDMEFCVELGYGDFDWKIMDELWFLILGCHFITVVYDKVEKNNNNLLQPKELILIFVVLEWNKER